MEDLLLQMYNQNLANQANQIFQNRNRNLINDAAMDVFKMGFRNQGLGSLGDISMIDDAGMEEEYYEDFPETGTFRSGIRSLADTLKNSRLANFALGAINPIFGGIGALVNRPGFQDFRRSDTLADFFQARRDRKAREEAAKRGAARQAAIVASQQVDTGGGEGSRPGGFGFGAGDFSPSDATATEGSF